MSQVDNLLETLSGVSQAGDSWTARCPAHDDRNPSLSIAEGDDGCALVKCHAGCTTEAICEAMGLKIADLMAPSAANGINAVDREPAKRIVATYDYRDEKGELVFQVVRYEPKDFRQRRPKPGGGWNWSAKGVPRIPYRLPEVLANANRTVLIVEGEKDVENLRRIDVIATCNAGGVGKWTDDHAAFLHGRNVAILADNDPVGAAHALNVANSLNGITATVKVLTLPDLPPKGDVSDWLAAGGTRERLDELVRSTSIWEPPSVPAEWPEIDAFDEQILPEFPTEILPPALREWVQAESLATQTPPDLAGLLALAVCSAGIARWVEVEPRRGWREPTNLFVAVLLEPGNRKSAVFADARRPLQEYEAELVEAARTEVARAQSARRQDEIRLRKLEKLAGEKQDQSARYEAEKLAQELAESPEPALPRLIVDDATSEKLGIMLAEQGGRLASMSPEGGVFDLMAGLYSKSGMPQFGVYLMGHSGDDLITDRVSRRSVRVERPALTCAYAMQPDVIAGIAENAAFRGRGLLGRFLYAAPKSWIGQREIAPPPMPETVRDEYWNIVRRLAATDQQNVLPLSDDAETSLRRWEARIEQMLGDGGDLETMRDWGGKLAGATLRIAGVLHCVEFGVGGCIDRETLEAAIEIAEYLQPHADAVLNLMQATAEAEDADAAYVLAWIKRHERREFTKRDAQQHGKRRFPKADDIDNALATLTDRGYIRPKPTTPVGPGRPPSPAYDVNPAIFDKDSSEKRPHNSQKSELPLASSDFENIESAFPELQSEERATVTI